MGRQRTTTFPDDIVALLAHIEAWRRKKRGGEAMPETLWQQAVGLARIHGITTTSCGLRVHHGELKRRSTIQDSLSKDTQPPAPQGIAPVPQGFVELKSATIFGDMGHRPTVIEMGGQRGQTIKITVGSTQQLDLGGLVQAFFGAAP